MKKKFTVELLGDGKLNIEEGQTILDASIKAGIPHYHACGGKGQCSTCRILVSSGGEYLSPLNDKEVALRRKAPFPPNVRLACQAFVTGSNVQIHRMIRDETDLRIYIKEDTLSNAEHTGKEQELALFFLDIRNFTPFMETYLPFDVIHIMRRLFSLFRNAVEANSGRIIETQGDGFYAVFGFSTAIAAGVQQACNAGFQILKDIEVFNDNYMHKHFRHRFKVGIGVHSGRVITGNIGIGVNNNLTVMGLPVNIAARLQATTKDFNNSFVISEIAFSLLKEKPKNLLTTVQLKGIKDDMACRLIGESYN
jgi:adenylate cyclase